METINNLIQIQNFLFVYNLILVIAISIMISKLLESIVEHEEIKNHKP